MGLQRSWMVLAACGAVLGCQSAAVDPAGVPIACQRFDGAATLPLPPAAAPADAPGPKAGPLRFANRIPVNGGIGDIGEWRKAARGWQSWRLRLISEDAKSLSVRLLPVVLPPAAELWLCTPGGSRQGPVRAQDLAADGYWSPQVAGPELWLEVLAPSAAVKDVQLTIAEAYAGFR